MRRPHTRRRDGERATSARGGWLRGWRGAGAAGVALAVAALGVGLARAEPPPSRAQDLEVARRDYVLASPAFSAAARRRALAFIARQAPRAAAMSDAEFLLTVLRIAAFADNAHDGENDHGDVWFPAARLPLRVIWFPDGWTVARAAPELAGLLGARVLAIEGLTPAAMLRRLAPLGGGPDSYRRWNLEWIVEHASLLHALGIAARADDLRLTLELTSGQRLERRLAFVPSAELPAGAGPVRLWSAEPWPGETDKGWRSAAAAQPPLYLADGAKLYRAVPLPELGALYVQLRANWDGAGESLVAFTQAVDAQLAERSPQHLLVDLRFDVGGNADLTREWLRSLPARIPGRLYVLVGRYTFSAGIVAAAALKHDGGAKVRLVGEELGDRLRWWSEGHDVCLPASHYCLHLTTGLWDLRRGCAGEAHCYGDRYQVTVGMLAPDLKAPLTSQAWLAGRDPGLEAIRRELAAR